MRIFKSKWFHRWAEKERLTDRALIEAVEEMNNGLIDADLGAHIYKKRTAIAGQGKRGSFRTILAFKMADKAFFIFGFAKKQKDNIDKKELKALKLMGKQLLNYSHPQLSQALKSGELIEVNINE